MPITTGDHLGLDRCPHCGTASPTLNMVHHVDLSSPNQDVRRHWAMYVCTRCIGCVLAESIGRGNSVTAHYPSSQQMPLDVPERPLAFLRQASDSLHAPAGAVMLAASAVDAMLKSRGLTEGHLYPRIDQAAKQHLI